MRPTGLAAIDAEIDMKTRARIVAAVSRMTDAQLHALAAAARREISRRELEHESNHDATVALSPFIVR